MASSWRITGLKRTVQIRMSANNPHLHNFISKSLRGRGEGDTMPEIESEPFLTIWPDLIEKLA